MEYAACTHTGKIRSTNEDCIYLPQQEGTPRIIIVADGMGGHNAGEVASSLAVKSLTDYFCHADTENINETEIRESLIRANDDVLRESYANVSYIGMGTTLTLAVLKQDELSLGARGRQPRVPLHPPGAAPHHPGPFLRAGAH